MTYLKNMREDVEKKNLARNSSHSSIVVYVLVDPIEAGDGYTDGMIGQKSTSLIYVVVLIESVKYVTDLFLHASF